MRPHRRVSWPVRARHVLAGALVGAALLGFGCGTGAAVAARPASVEAPRAAEAPPVPLPNRQGSLKFAVLGDFGTGAKVEYDLAGQMAKLEDRFKLDLVVMVGDNLYGSERPQDFKKKFEEPYKALLDAKVPFYAALGNHDARTQIDYKLFNMNGKLYYTLKAPHQKVRFFMLDSTYPVPEQIAWLEKELKASNEDWKIAVFHHPLYSSGGRHGSDLQLRQTLEPLFIKYDVSVAFTGHDHFYERIKPQHGIVHFVVGSGGRLAPDDIGKPSDLTARGFDTDQAFMAVEIDGDTMTFNAISRTGEIVDSGRITRRRPEPAKAAG
ncbi:MAG TPA: metallophosphoesterase [Candidatus Polarisedimenticolia bacterium]|nr:metallophosphoesterase [Candidatus Polarisedimenticolia bacterium]